MKRVLLLSSACLFIAGKVAAQTSDGEIVVIGTIIGESEISNLSSPVGILTAEDIENRNQNYIGELLRSQPGVSISRSGPGGSLTQIRLRGTEASHVLVLVDGIEVANPIAGEFDLSGIRAADVERIEILRGEQSALYGSDAIGGVINIITKTGATKEYWQASTEAGSFGTFDGQVSGAIPLGHTVLTLGAGGLSTGGYDISGLNGEHDGSKSHSFNAGLNNLDLGGVTLSGKYTNTYLNTDFDEDLFDPVTFSSDGRLDNTESYTLVDTQSARIDAHFELGRLKNLVTLSGHDIHSNSRAEFSSTSQGLRKKAGWALKYVMNQHDLTFQIETETEKYVSGSIDETNRLYGLSGDYRYTTENFSLSASARQDFNDRFDDAQTWKLGGTYGFDFGGRIRASVGTGVKNPSMVELFGFPSFRFGANPNLMPETSFGYNLGYSHKFSGPEIMITVDYFNSKLNDEIYTGFDGQGFVALNRITKSQRRGAEFSAKWNPSDDVSLYGSTTILDTKENGVEEIRRPGLSASMTATWRPIDALSLTGSVDHTGSQMDTDFGNCPPPTFACNDVELSAFTLVGLNAALDVSDNVTLTLRGENLLDEDYEEVVGYRSQGRGVYGGLRLRFD